MEILLIILYLLFIFAFVQVIRVLIFLVKLFLKSHSSLSKKQILSPEEKRELFTTIIRHLFIWR